jgi:hypothetical protein
MCPGVLIGKFYLVDAGYAARPGFLPLYHATSYHLREYGGRNPQNQKELFNLRHSALRVTIEWAFGALKNRFKIMYNKPFYSYKTQVKLILACYILHNWILRHDEDDHIPHEYNWPPNEHNEAEPHDWATDSNAWAAQRDAWAAQMWQNRGSSHV